MTTSNVEEKKSELRTMIRERRKTLTTEWVEEHSLRAQQNILELVEVMQADPVAVYMALPAEVQTSLIIETCREAGQRICVPCFDEAHNCYAWAWLEADAPTSMGHWHVPEFRNPRWVTDARLEVVIAPAVALDRKGGRLGHGGGHYDHLMVSAGSLKIGLAFEFQVVDEVPMDEHDIGLDMVATEQAVYDCRI